ncbi:MAG TPA: hypothetical protein VJX69_16160 [Terriglobales bacterium]|nr:hypothetical protein [Terriglobales bacterium]
MSTAASASQKMASRSPMAQLLHALNQPLTGLQCSMEVALASPRTAGQYVQGLREGLTLTGRMRALVEAMREIADIGEEKDTKPETIELTNLLQEAVEELKPVAEVKGVRTFFLAGPETSCVVRARRAEMASAMFRLVDSVVSLASRGTALQIETYCQSSGMQLRMQWQSEGSGSALSRPELGLLIARARLERAGAEWEREAIEAMETLSLRLPGVSHQSVE